MLTCRRSRPVKSYCETKNRRDRHPAMDCSFLIELESGLGGIPLGIPARRVGNLTRKVRFSHNNDIVEIPLPRALPKKNPSAVISLDSLAHTRTPKNPISGHLKVRIKIAKWSLPGRRQIRIRIANFGPNAVSHNPDISRQIG